MMMNKKLGPCTCDVCNIPCHYTYTYSSASDSYTFIAQCHGEFDRCVVKADDFSGWNFDGLRAFTRKNREKQVLTLTSTSPMKEPMREPLLCLEYKSKKAEEPVLHPVGTSLDVGGPEEWGYKIGMAL